MRVLLIDDDEVRTHPLVQYINNMTTWYIDWVKTPAAAIGALGKPDQQYDVILLDIMMPPDEMIDAVESDLGFATGLALLPKIHTITHGDVPVMIYSARQDLAFLAKDNRVAAYITKPASPQDVTQQIQALL